MNKAEEFDEIASGPFFPIYQVLAKQIVERTGIKTGICLDMGCGGGHLGLSFAKECEDIKLFLLDISEDATKIASKRALEWDLAETTKVVCSDVHYLPFEDEYFDICISRGSVWFWEDQKKAFEEVYRTLKPGGFAYIGGGFGTEELKDQVYVEMKKRDNEWPKRRDKFTEGNTVDHFSGILKSIGIHGFDVEDDEKGIWVIFKKPNTPSN